MPSESSRSRSRSHSRRRSRSRDSRRHRRSRSRSPGGHGGHRRRSKSGSRSVSRSPMSNRKRHIGTRDNPPVSKCLGIFGLSTRTTEADLRDVFDRYPGFIGVKLICDYGSGTSRGFGFLTFESVDDARYVKDKCVGMDIDGRSIRIDFSTTTRAHTPTPGRYMGRPSYRPRYSRERDYGGGGRSSRYERRRHSRSYSRSPRRY